MSAETDWAAWDDMVKDAPVLTADEISELSIFTHSGGTLEQFMERKEAKITTAKTMAEVLAELNYEAEQGDDAWATCPEDARPGWIRYGELMEAALTAAGFGLVADAKAEALEDLAKELEWVKPESSPCGDTESCCGSESSCDAMRPSVFVTGPASLRARAAAVRGEG